jgi:hypothetical protein
MSLYPVPVGRLAGLLHASFSDVLSGHQLALRWCSLRPTRAKDFHLQVTRHDWHRIGAGTSGLRLRRLEDDTRPYPTKLIVTVSDPTVVVVRIFPPAVSRFKISPFCRFVVVVPLQAIAEVNVTGVNFGNEEVGSP